MNALSGVIRSVRGEDQISLVEIEVEGISMRSVVIDPPNASYLQPGASVTVLFKETEVSIALPGNHPISLQNRLPCDVHAIHKGELLARIELKFNAHILESVVTAKAVDDLGLSKGKLVLAMIKTNEVMLKT